MSTLSQLTPHNWFLKGVGDVSTGSRSRECGWSIAVLALIGLVAGPFGMWRARRAVVSSFSQASISRASTRPRTLRERSNLFFVFRCR